MPRSHPPRILVSVETRKKGLLEPGFAETLFSEWWEKFPLLVPEFAQDYEPIRQPVPNPQSCVEQFKKRCFLWKRKQRIKSEGTIFLGDNRLCTSFRLWTKGCPDFDWESFFDWVCEKFEPEFGYLHIVTEKEFENSGLSIEAANAFFLGAPMKKIEQLGIPNLGWKTVFSRRFTAQFNVPLEMAEEHEFLKITDDLTDVIENYDDFDTRSRVLRHSLGIL